MVTLKKQVHIDERTNKMISEMRKERIYNLSFKVREMISADYYKFKKEQKQEAKAKKEKSKN